MGNVQGYVKVKDRDKSERHLIKLNQLCNERNWNDMHVYDFQKNELGLIKNGKYEKMKIVYIPGIGDCYVYHTKGKLELYHAKTFLEHLKDAAVEHINNTFKIKDEEELINL